MVFQELLPFICVAIFVFTAWLIFEIVGYFLRPGAARELVCPGKTDEMVTRRKRLLSIYEIYSPDTKPELNNQSRRSFSRVISVRPAVKTIDEKSIECDDHPPSYAQIVLSVDNLPTNVRCPPPPSFEQVHKDKDIESQ